MPLQSSPNVLIISAIFCWQMQKKRLSGRFCYNTHITKNPVINALAALAYIVIVAGAMFYGTDNADPAEGSILAPILAPIAFISLFTLSAAVMGYVFLGQPLQLYLDNKKKEAVSLFLQTLAVFAGFTAVILLVFFFSVGS